MNPNIHKINYYHHRILESKLVEYVNHFSAVGLTLIIDRKQTRELIEIKAGETFTPRMTKEIEKLKDQNTTGYLLYRGKTIPYLPDVHVMNYKKYLAPKAPR